MLSTYLNTLAGAGFRLERLLEPATTGPGISGTRSVPSFLLARAVATT
jgi:hypothetical protein